MKLQNLIKTRSFWKIYGLRALFSFALGLISTLLSAIFLGNAGAWIYFVIALLWVWVDDVMMISMLRQAIHGENRLRTLFDRGLNTLERNIPSTLLIYAIYTLLFDVFIASIFGVLLVIGAAIAYAASFAAFFLLIPAALFSTMFFALFLFARLYTISKISAKLYGTPVETSKTFVIAVAIAFAALLIVLLFGLITWIISSFIPGAAGVLLWILVRIAAFLVPYIMLLIDQLWTGSLFLQTGLSADLVSKVQNSLSTLQNGRPVLPSLPENDEQPAAQEEPGLLEEAIVSDQQGDVLILEETVQVEGVKNPPLPEQALSESESEDRSDV